MLPSTTPSPHPFRFGLVAAQARSGAAWRDLATRAEALGYASLLMPDGPGPILSPLPALATAAACTSRLHVGTWVLANDFHNPVLVAREAATLDLLSDGRYELGLGAGRGDHDYASVGLPPAGSGGQRLRRLVEALQLIRALFATERVTFEGEFYSVRNASLFPRPQRPPRILIAASGPKAVEVAARYADSVALGSHSRELFEQQRRGLAAAAPERAAEIELASLVYVVPEGDRAAAESASAMARRLGGEDIEAMVAREAPNVLVGSQAAMIEQLEERRTNLGLSYIVLSAQSAEAFAPIVARLSGT